MLFIADTHFGHENIIRFDRRPFSTAHEMDEALIANWNCAVCQQDTVYVLGDMFWCNMETSIAILERLNGRKRLIKGNHDKCRDGRFLQCYESVSEYEEMTINGKLVIMSHYPMAHWKGQRAGAAHLYGHIHNGSDFVMYGAYQKSCEMAGIPFKAYNVGCMMPFMDYTPRTLDEIEGR